MRLRGGVLAAVITHTTRAYVENAAALAYAKLCAEVLEVKEAVEHSRQHKRTGRSCRDGSHHC